MAEMPPLDADVWELYGPDDWTQATTWPRNSPRSSQSCSACS